MEFTLRSYRQDIIDKYVSAGFVYLASEIRFPMVQPDIWVIVYLSVSIDKEYCISLINSA